MHRQFKHESTVKHAQRICLLGTAILGQAFIEEAHIVAGNGNQLLNSKVDHEFWFLDHNGLGRIILVIVVRVGIQKLGGSQRLFDIIFTDRREQSLMQTMSGAGHCKSHKRTGAYERTGGQTNTIARMRYTHLHKYEHATHAMQQHDASRQRM